MAYCCLLQEAPRSMWCFSSFLGGEGLQKKKETGAKFIIRDTAEQVGKHKETVC